jgi:hypothetical protein
MAMRNSHVIVKTVASKMKPYKAWFMISAGKSNSMGVFNISKMFTPEVCSIILVLLS